MSSAPPAVYRELGLDVSGCHSTLSPGDDSVVKRLCNARRKTDRKTRVHSLRNPHKKQVGTVAPLSFPPQKEETGVLKASWLGREP